MSNESPDLDAALRGALPPSADDHLFATRPLSLGALIAAYSGDPLTPDQQLEWEAYQESVLEAEARRSALGLVDLAEVMREGVTEAEMLVDNLFVRASHHVVYGTKESGKTWLLLVAAADLIKRGEVVLWVDEEMGRRDLAGRLSALGLAPDAVEDFFVYLEFPSLNGSDASRALWTALLDWKRPSLIIVDAQTEVLAAADLNENLGTDVAKWNSWYLAPARTLGAATAFIDHTGHDTSGRPVGSRHKGAQSKVELEVTREKRFNHSQLGVIKVVETKDTLSAPIPKEQRFELGGAPTDVGGWEFVFRAFAGSNEDDPKARADRELRERVTATIREHGPLTGNAVYNLIGGNRTRVLKMVANLAGSETSKVVGQPGTRNSVLYSWAGGVAQPETAKKALRATAKRKSRAKSSRRTEQPDE